jgi:hypothetical protein
VLLNGLNKYYGFTENPRILLNGSSMAMSGFNREDIENLTKMQIATYAHEGVSVSDRYAMIKHFFQICPEGVKTVIYEVNHVIFSNIKTSENIYTLFYPYMDDITINNYIKEKASIKEYYIHKVIRTKRFDARLIRTIMMGYLNLYENLKTNTLDTAKLLPFVDEKEKTEVIIEQSNVKVFENTMDLIRSHNASIILVMMPIYYIKLQTFNNKGYRNLCKYFEDYCSTRKDIEFLDLNLDSAIRNTMYFSDPLHFNVYGQRHITNLISNHLIEK